MALLLRLLCWHCCACSSFAAVLPLVRSTLTSCTSPNIRIRDVMSHCEARQACFTRKCNLCHVICQFIMCCPPMTCSLSKADMQLFVMGCQDGHLLRKAAPRAFGRLACQGVLLSCRLVSSHNARSAICSCAIRLWLLSTLLLL